MHALNKVHCYTKQSIISARKMMTKSLMKLIITAFLSATLLAIGQSKFLFDSSKLNIDHNLLLLYQC